MPLWAWALGLLLLVVLFVWAQFLAERERDRIYCFWTGTNPMSADRAEALLSMQRHLSTDKTELVYLDATSLRAYEKKEHPFHPAYAYLSETHKSDYLRCYFMHFYGGGYSDIKRHAQNWDAQFLYLRENESCWVVGYAEPAGPSGIAAGAPNIVRNNWRKNIGCGAFICRRDTQFTKEWLEETELRLSQLEKDLSKHPARWPQDALGYFDAKGVPSSYPVSWSGLLGDAFHPLCWKHEARVRAALPDLCTALYR